MTFSLRNLRDALSHFATGVTIVTALDEKSRPIGMTASSFNSVSMEPPLVLWSVTNNALSAKAFADASHFGIHILSTQQSETSNIFASRGEDKFAHVDYAISPEGIPQIEGCLVRFDCKHWATYDGGDHTIIVGEVVNIEETQGNGLIFQQGTYAVANPLRPTKQDNSRADDSSEAPIEDMLLYQLSRSYRQLSSQFHQAVFDSDLNLPDWRILASLSGGISLPITSLIPRTFLDLEVLQDMVQRLEEAGLCVIEDTGDEINVRSTGAGEERVAHLFHLSKIHEGEALKDADNTTRENLMSALRLIVKNT